jgi:capsular polysaccharide biosynthesis protein
MTLSAFKDALRGHRLLILLTTLAITFGALGISLMTHPTYQASARVYIDTAPPLSGPGALEGFVYAKRQVGAYAQLLFTADLLQRAIDANSLGVSAGDLASRVAVTSPSDTVLLDIAIKDTSPQEAQRQANAVAAEFANAVTRHETQDGLIGARGLVAEPAVVPTGPIAPFTVRNVLLGIVFGLQFGCALAVVRSLTDRRLKDANELADRIGVPLLGEFASPKRGPGITQWIRRNSGPLAVEAFREIAVNIRRSLGAESPGVLAVVGARKGDRAAIAGIDIALSLAGAGLTVAIVDAAGKSFLVAKRLKGSAVPGLSVVRTTRERGGEVPDIGVLHAVIDGQRRRADYVILLLPPLLVVPDAARVCGTADGCLVVARRLVTTQDDVSATVGYIEGVGAYVRGVIVAQSAKYDRAARPPV